MKNKAKEIQARIREIQDKRRSTQAEINQKIAEASQEEEMAKTAAGRAAEAMDYDAYHKAQQALKAAKEWKEMMQARAAQLSVGRIVTEAESDAVIDQLLQYEEDLAAEYAEQISKPIEELKNIQADYKKNVEEAEAVIREWTLTIHPNYRSQGTTYANGTNRADQPVPVRRSTYTGSSLSQRMAEFLEKVKPGS